MFKFKVVIVLIALIAVIVGWFYISNTQERLQQAEQVLTDIEKLRSEQDRCEQILSQESGDFAQYEYCQGLLRNFPRE